MLSLVGLTTIYEMLWMASKTPSGAFVEVGVYQGGSAIHIDHLAKLQDRECYLYDTFSGIPYKRPIDSHQIGDFRETSIGLVKSLIPHAIVTKGVFPESAIPMTPIAFVHLDCDQYDSIRNSLLYLLPKMVSGGLIWLDDSPCLEGARTAAMEIFGDRLQLSHSNKHYVIL